MAAVTTTTTDTTTGDAKPGRGARPRPPALPYVLLLPSVVVLGDARLPARAARHHVDAGVRPAAGVRATRPVGRSRQLPYDPRRRALLDRLVARRTLIFCFVNVALTMVLGVLVALLLDALGRGMRLLVSVSLIVAWAMPALTATIVWQWMFDTEYGLANWALGGRARAGGQTN